MKTNSASGHPTYGSPAVLPLSHIAWRTESPIDLPAGSLSASGEAIPQVRSPEKLAGLGANPAEQVTAIGQIIVAALEQILLGMEPAAAEIAGLQDEIASATLVAANSRLGKYDVALLDLTLTLTLSQGEREPEPPSPKRRGPG